MSEPDFATIVADAWALLAAGAGDRRHPVHTPVVASVDAEGRPQARVLVLRAADAASATLRFHTDARSPKLAEVVGRPVSILAYDPGSAVQLRLAGTARLADSVAADAAWAAATPFARRCYLATAAPGTAAPAPTSGLPAAVEGRKPEEAELLPARDNFAVLLMEVDEIDWLHLAATGHRRARLRRGDGGWRGEWRVP
ncbi:hypothetical protein IP88_07725 [alpha proteobacterium AAP81b]|nr:hypothetical protein IP88_07725 [alpha proteobacterium AAP81b]